MCFDRKIFCIPHLYFWHSFVLQDDFKNSAKSPTLAYTEAIKGGMHMIRFKVIRGSHLLFGLSALILAGVIIFMILQGFPAKSSTPGYSNIEAKAITAFASNPSSEKTLQIEVIADKPNHAPLADALSILIYHTHTHEAYEQTNNAAYNVLEAWRTKDEQHNIVRVGALLSEELQKRGYFVMHDTTDHERNDIDLAYVRALETLESYSMTFDLVIDLHRDAYSEGLQTALNDDKDSYAQIMLLVGNGGNYRGDKAPNYKKNLDFAQRLTKELNESKKGIARNVTVKNGRYNQHIGKTAVLIEVGHNKNTLEEALNSVPYLAEAIDRSLK